MEKTLVNFENAFEKAITKYVKDEEHTEFTANQILTLTSFKKAIPAERILPSLFAGSPITSTKMNSFLKEVKLRINLLGSQTMLLNQEVRSAATDFWSTLDDIQSELKALDSDIQEEEIKAEDKYQLVHFNAFNRPIDTQVRVQQVDPKTGLPFLIDQQLHLIPGAGLTLPVVRQEKIFIRDIILLDEFTDVGDTARPIIQTDPRNLLDPDLSFRYVIARQTYDDTGRLYNYVESTCKLQILLGHIQLINHINLRPLSHSPLFVKSVEYLNEAGEKVTIELDTLFLDGNLTILTEPIRTNNLFITLAQKAPVEETLVPTGDIQVLEINKVLEGAKFGTLLPDDGKWLKAKVYDFSLEAISIELLTYKQSGYFLSQKIECQKLLSLALNVSTEMIRVTTEQRAYNASFFLPEGTVLYETYARVKLGTNEHKQIESLIPVPSMKQQIESLPLLGGQSPLCFVPDLFYTSFKKKIKQATYLDNNVFVEFYEPHNIATGIIYTDRIEIFVGTESNNHNCFSISWSATSSTVLALDRNDNVNLSLQIVDENHIPQAYVVRHLNADPFNISAEDIELVLGTDFEFSMDSGVTWLSELPTLAQVAELKEILFAGSFRIKILKPDYSQYYWCKYKRANKQYLHSNKLFLLKKNTVIVNKKLRNLQGSIQTMIILRSDSRIPYLSSIIHNYKLKVRQ